MSRFKGGQLKFELGFRQALPVTEVRLFRDGWTYPVCPRCKITMEREYQNFCDRCGQRLDWSRFH